jgi:hypothetical protein
MTEDCSRDCKIGDEKKKNLVWEYSRHAMQEIVDGREDRRRVKMKE